MNRYMRIALLPLACVYLASCAAPADSRAMVPNNLATGKRFSKSVSIVVTGGQKTNPMWSSQVANEDFATALQTTIEKNGLFSRVIRSGNADYKLDVRLIQLHQPSFGLNFTVKGDIEWRLRHVSSDRLVWDGRTDRSYTVTVGEAPVGIKRLRLANEGAIRENIKAGLEHIASLSL